MDEPTEVVTGSVPFGVVCDLVVEYVALPPRGCCIRGNLLARVKTLLKLGAP
jgi:hypothetical protein